MERITNRQLYKLFQECGLRVCASNHFHGCPYGENGLIDCNERLENDFMEMVERLLDMEEAAH